MKKDYITNLRQKELYSLLEGVPEGTFIDQEALVNMSVLYPIYEKGSFHNSTARRLLSKDIQDINSDPAFPRIIVSSSGRRGVKLATKEEAQQFLATTKNRCFQKLRRLNAISEKIDLYFQIGLEV